MEIPNNNEPKKRKSYTAAYKLNVIKDAKLTTNSDAARLYKIDESLVRRWRKNEDNLELLPKQSKIMIKKVRSPRWPELEYLLSMWVLEEREKGMQISGTNMLIKARSIASGLGINFIGSCKWIYNFMKRNDLVVRAVTSTGQHLPIDWEEKRHCFQSFVASNITTLKLNQIGNMDEVAVSFDMPSKFTISKKGSEDIKITTTGSERKTFTVALTILANGKKLPPYVIFKRKTIPRIKIPKNIISANEKGWMSSNEMCLWIEKVWNIRPESFFDKKNLLILDSAPGHKTNDILKIFKSTKTIPAIIPGGLTSLLQPLDISVNKSFKSKLRKYWEIFMFESYEKFKLIGTPLKRISYEEIVNWISRAWDEISEPTIINGFRKTNIAFYEEDHPSIVGKNIEEEVEENVGDSDIENLADEDINNFITFVSEGIQFIDHE